MLIFVLNSLFFRRNSTQTLPIVVFRGVLCFLNCVVTKTVPRDVNRNLFKKYYMIRSVYETLGKILKLQDFSEPLTY